MTDHRARIATVGRAILHEIRVERVTFMAGSIAYNAFVSLLPLLLLLLAFISVLGSHSLEEGFLQLTNAVVTPEIGDVLVDELRGAPVGASMIGLVALTWGMLRIFRNLDMAFSNIYETTSRNTFRNQLHDGTIAFVSVTAVVIGAVLVHQSLPTESVQGGWVIQRVALVLVISAALVPLYYLFPDEPDMDIVECLPGVAFAAVSLVIFESLFGLYTTYGGPSVDNSVLAGILIFLAWLYFCSLIILLGVVINAVLTNRSEDVSITPVIGNYEPATANADVKPISEETLRELNQALTDATTIDIQIDGEQTVSMPAPDLTALDRSASSSPFIADAAGIELRWSHLASQDIFTE